MPARDGVSPARTLQRCEAQRRHREDARMHAELRIDQHVEVHCPHGLRERREGEPSLLKRLRRRLDFAGHFVGPVVQGVHQNLETLAVEFRYPALEIVACRAAVEEDRDESDPETPPASRPGRDRPVILRKRRLEDRSLESGEFRLQVPVVATLVGKVEIVPLNAANALRRAERVGQARRLGHQGGEALCICGAPFVDFCAARVNLRQRKREADVGAKAGRLDRGRLPVALEGCAAFPLLRQDLPEDRQCLDAARVQSRRPPQRLLGAVEVHPLPMQSTEPQVCLCEPRLQFGGTFQAGFRRVELSFSEVMEAEAEMRMGVLRVDTSRVRPGRGRRRRSPGGPGRARPGARR